MLGSPELQAIMLSLGRRTRSSARRAALGVPNRSTHSPYRTPNAIVPCAAAAWLELRLPNDAVLAGLTVHLQASIVGKSRAPRLTGVVSEAILR